MASEFENLAAQLRRPSGEEGIAVAQLMHETNIGMTLHALESLSLQDHETVLELGHGNGAHLPRVLERAANLHYVGLELSTLMHEQAQTINASFVAQRQAFFALYDGLHIPFGDQHFDKIFSVNTIYFWANPAQLLQELARVLKPTGQLNLTFAQKDFMSQLPFTQYGFELYDAPKFEQLVNQSDFKIQAIQLQQEMVRTKRGDLVQREFATASLKKTNLNIRS